MQIASFIARWLSAWVALVVKYPIVVLVIGVVLSGAAWQYMTNTLGVNTDTADMISPDLPWRQRYLDFITSVPALRATLTLVIDGKSAEAAEAAAKQLLRRLSGESEFIEWVYAPELDPFFERNGLLYLDVDELEALTARLAAAQPLLGGLNRRPAVSELFGLLQQLPAAGGPIDSGPLTRLMDGLSAVMAAAGGPGEQRVSWRAVMAAQTPSAADRGQFIWRQFIFVKAKLDYSELLPAGPVIARIRDIATELSLRGTSSTRMRITGASAMAHEELRTVTRGMKVAAISAGILVTLVLLLGLRSWRAVLAVMIALAMGLLWTGAFAAFAVGRLNLISVAFAVLYIGLGVDYAVHYCLRHRELVCSGEPPVSALITGARDVGTSLVLCAITTGVGFFAFVPTDFAGVSELGIISGAGMFISLFASVTALPAALSVLGGNHGALPGLGQNKRRRLPRGIVLWAALAGALAGAVALPFAHFDHNPIHLRDPQTESVATYLELMDDAGSAPWTLSILDHPDSLRAVAPKLEQLREVHGTRSLADFIPAQQEDKLAIVADLELLLGHTLSEPGRSVPDSAARTRSALAKMLAAMQGYRAEDAGVDAARARLARCGRALITKLDEAASAESVARDLHERVFEYFPATILRLERSLQADHVTLDDLPPALAERWRAADGRWRMEVKPSEDLNDNDALVRFVRAVQAVASNATGTPEVNLGASDVVVGSFVQAFTSALVLIFFLLWIITGSLKDVLLVLAPLLLAALLTAACMALFSLPFNFANVIALPLLLGIGVDNGIHLVHRARVAPPTGSCLLGTSTARAIVISALTTICGFGNLAYSAHPGTASMGLVLTIGLMLTLVATLVVLPALLVKPSVRT